MNKKIAIVTGASRGIGKTVALDLAKDHHVILIARSQNALQELKSAIEKRGQTADFYVLDVSDPEKVKSTLEDIIKRFHQIDLLFNNAGILKSGTMDLAVSDINDVIKVNLLGVIYIGNHVGQQMKKQNHGYIINISSMAGKRGLAANGIYCASKFGVLGYTESLHKELIPHGVKVTAICPGTVATEMTQSFSFDQELMIQPEDIAKTVRYLLTIGANASIPEVMVQCAPFEAHVTQATTDKLLSTKKD